MDELAADDGTVLNGLHQVTVGGCTSYGATVLLGFVCTLGFFVALIYLARHRPRGEALPAYAAALASLLFDANVIWRIQYGPASRFGSWWHYASSFAAFTLVNLSVALRLYRWRLNRFNWPTGPPSE